MFPKPAVPSIRPADVADDAFVLDVREDDEWVAGHAPQALHVPLGELPARAAAVPVDREVVVVCRVGGRSAQAVAWLNGQGWSTVNLDGGMQAWAAAGRPLESAGGSPTVI